MPIGATNVAQGNSNNPNVTINSQASGSSFSILVQWGSAANFSSISDTIGGGASGNTWTQVGSEISNFNGLVDCRQYYVSAGFNGGTTHRFSVSLSASDYWSISVVEVLDVDTANPITGTPVFGPTDSATPFASTAVDTTAANAMLVSTCIPNVSAGTVTFTADASSVPTSGWTVEAGATFGAASTNYVLSQMTQAVTSTGSYVGAWTATFATSAIVGLIAFRDDGGGQSVALDAAAAAAATAAGDVSAADPRYGRPRADVSAGGWTPSSGSDLYAMLDESVADDGDYISVLSASTCEVHLRDIVNPGGTAGRVVRFRSPAGYTASGGVVVSLRQGSTEIAAWTINPIAANTTYERTLDAGQVGSLVSADGVYRDLRLRFEAVN
jgi:hypothetical protein